MPALFESVTAHQRLLEEGDRLLNAGQFQLAYKRYEQAFTLRPNAKTAYSLGLACEKLGRLDEAVALYTGALDHEASFLEARVNLGCLLREKRSFEAALHHHAAAAALAPHHQLTGYNLGLTLSKSGRLRAARQVLQACAAAHPDFALVRKVLRGLGPSPAQRAPGSPAHCREALAAVRDGRDAEAAALFEAFLARTNGSAEAWTDYGSALLRLGRIEDALRAQDRALALNPVLAPAHHNKGAVLQALGRHEAAVESYRDAVALAPQQALSWFALGKSLLALSRLEQAWDAFFVAGYVDPPLPDALITLCELSRDLRRFEAATAAMERLNTIWPDNFLVHNNLGACLLDQHRLEEALACFDKAVALNPGSALSHSNRGAVFELSQRFRDAHAAYGSAYALAPDDSGMLARLVHVSQYIAAWDGLEDLFPRMQAAARAEGMAPVQPFSLLAVPGITPDDQRHAATALATRSYGRLGGFPRPAARPAGGRKLRIGYLSSDLYNHATAWLMAEIVELHDRSRFESIAYSYGLKVEDDTRQRLRQGFDQFRDISGLLDHEAAERIREDRIDILIDLKGYTQNTRSGILAYRPAPVQINYLGFPGTMGADFVDFIIADPVVIPPELERHYTERVLRMPHCYQPNDRKRPLPPAPPRSAVGLPEDAFVFCSFNNVYKITPDVFDIWCRLLREVPDGVLWILSSVEAANANLVREAEARGVDGSRLIFAPRADLASHLARFRCADLFLDTFPCTAHTTASDALWAGVPVVTRIGDTFASRVAASILHAAELPQLVTDDAEGYYAVAARLATRREELRALKAHLEAVRFTCPLFDSPAYTRDLERLYEQAIAEAAAPR